MMVYPACFLSGSSAMARGRPQRQTAMLIISICRDLESTGRTSIDCPGSLPVQMVYPACFPSGSSAMARGRGTATNSSVHHFNLSRTRESTGRTSIKYIPPGRVRANDSFACIPVSFASTCVVDNGKHVWL
jgi:hypothetical protein